MSGLNFNRETTSSIPMQPNRRGAEKYSKIRKSDAAMCNVHNILISMRDEQKEHQYARFADSYVKYRRVVAEWMMDVCDYFGLHPTTTHAAIAYLDRLQPSDKFSRYEWQMLAICCILIAAKYNESEEDVPDLRTLEEITQQPIPNETVLNYELWALKKMGWKLNARTPLAFVASYVVAGVTCPGDVCWDATRNTKYSLDELDSRICEELYSMSSFCMLQAELKGYRASDLASGMLYFVRRAMGVVPIWPKEMESMTKMSSSSDELLSIVRVFEDLLLPPLPPVPPLQRSPTSSATALSPSEGSVSARGVVASSSSSVRTYYHYSHHQNNGSPVQVQAHSSQAGTEDVFTPVSSSHALRSSREYATGVHDAASPYSTSSETDAAVAALTVAVGALRQHASPQSMADMIASPEEKDKENFYDKGPASMGMNSDMHGGASASTGAGARYPPIVAAIPMASLQRVAEI